MEKGRETDSKRDSDRSVCRNSNVITAVDYFRNINMVQKHVRITSEAEREDTMGSKGLKEKKTKEKGSWQKRAKERNIN